MKKRLLALLLLILVFPVWANLPAGFGFDEEEEEDTAPQRVEPDPMREMLRTLRNELPASQLLELPLADDETFLALQLEALSARPKGRLLLLPGDGLHPDWPLGIAPIRRNLPEYGWHTLSLSLPAYRPLGVAPRTLPPGPLLSRMPQNQKPVKQDEPDAAASAGFGFAEEDEEEPVVQERPDPAERLAQHREKVEARVQSALNHVGSGGKLVLVLQGESVYWLQPWLESGRLGRQVPLILLHVEAPVGADPTSIADTLRRLGANRPILDIYNASNQEQRHLAEIRKAAYRRAGNQQAVQFPMNFESGARAATTDRWLSQRVEGWLRGL
ncbi:DUF3530 family protein [Marinospirillum alkaliphilum]|uniref:DUF3530 domain-containing protein n=1 Tax=Marinospirillum alkaliphilum DSM 21637 TaxID=1122209 RepID=A0A1K1VI23_9GAMM|nr:DUF3530 family protein [Marinospirillum alkaliphilum]SFX24411.1 Protein of unknown function [Marinospirillum alkaliphilum DSM 21637]